MFGDTPLSKPKCMQHQVFTSNADDRIQGIIDCGNDLVPPGNRPLPEPMLTQVYVAVWRHRAKVDQMCYAKWAHFSVHTSFYICENNVSIA